MSARAPSWNSAPASLDLPEGTIDVWRAEAPLPKEREQALLGVLSDSERERAQRFLVELPKQTFIAARAMLRMALGRYLSVSAAEICFGYGEHGKPFLAGEGAKSGIEFNVSHSGGAILMAFLRGRPVGIDIEQIRENVEFEALATRYFSRREAAKLVGKTAGRERALAFYRCWTRKEAYLKLKGAGLSFPLDRFEVAFLGDEEPALLETEVEGDRPGDFWLTPLAAHPDYEAALIAPQPPAHLRRWRLAD